MNGFDDSKLFAAPSHAWEALSVTTARVRLRRSGQAQSLTLYPARAKGGQRSNGERRFLTEGGAAQPQPQEAVSYQNSFRKLPPEAAGLTSVASNVRVGSDIEVR